MNTKNGGQGNGGKPEYEVKRTREVEKHIQENETLKQDERNKLLRDDGWNLDIGIEWKYMKRHATKSKAQRTFFGPN